MCESMNATPAHGTWNPQLRRNLGNAEIEPKPHSTTQSVWVFVCCKNAQCTIIYYNFSNLGGYDLSDAGAASDMTDRLLSMLMEYLSSNQNLELNKTFKIYLKVLSVAHMKHVKKKGRRPIGKLHVGTGASNPIHYWSLSPPTNEDTFANKCLLMCTIFSLLQHAYFKSDHLDRRYLKILHCNSSVINLKNAAYKLIKKELYELFNTTGLKSVGPYELQVTIKLLSTHYKCQFFIFDGLANSSKLCFMYPAQYDDSLKPVFLFKPSSTTDHVIFIRHINSYFKSNYYICFPCKKKFKYPKRMHLCPKQATCFACRRLFMSAKTFIHQGLLQYFCDKFVTMDKPFLCKICSCTMNSSHCYSGHRLICNGEGHFGFKCLNHCKRFFYANSPITSKQLRESHSCFDFSICRFCYQTKEIDHLCKLRWPKPLVSHNRLCFFNIIFQMDETSEPVLALFYREEDERGNFTKYSFLNDGPITYTEDIVKNYVHFNYFPDILNDIKTDFECLNRRKRKKSTEDFRRNLAKLNEYQLRTKILSFILDENFRHTTFICNSASTQKVLVSLI